MKRTLLAVIIILGVVFRIWVSQPTWMNGDENYYINIFQNYVDRGELTPYMWRLGGDTTIIAGSGTGYGIFVLIGWMLVFGESLFGVRMLMVLAGLITAWVYYLISKKWWGNHEAGIAALVFGIVSTSSFYTLVGRMDAIAILSYSLLLLLHIVAVRQEKKWPHFLVGVVAILTTEFHIIGLLYVGALAVFYGIKYLQIVKSEKYLMLNTYPIYFFLGAGLMGVLYIFVHILPNPDAYFVIPNSCAICTSNRMQAETFRIIKMFIYRPHEIVLGIIILYSAIRLRSKNQHFLLVFFGYLLTQIVVSPPDYIQYAHHGLPLLSIGLGGFIAQFISITKRPEVAKIVLLIVSLILLVSNLFPIVMDQFPFENAFLMPDTLEIDYIREKIPKSTVIMSLEGIFYPLREYRNFVNYSEQIQYGLLLRGEEIEDFYHRLDIQVVYLNIRHIKNDAALQQFLTEKDLVRVLPKLWVARELVPSE